MQKLILSLFTLILLSSGSTAWGADKSPAKSTDNYDDSWAVRHPEALELWQVSQLFQNYERAPIAEQPTHLAHLITAINTDITAHRLVPTTRRFLVKKAHRAHGITKDGPPDAEAAEIAKIQAYLAELLRSTR